MLKHKLKLDYTTTQFRRAARIGLGLLCNKGRIYRIKSRRECYRTAGVCLGLPLTVLTVFFVFIFVILILSEGFHADGHNMIVGRWQMMNLRCLLAVWNTN